MEMEGPALQASNQLIMADLDHFKSINGAYGHEEGNAASPGEQNLARSIRVIDGPAGTAEKNLHSSFRAPAWCSR